MKAALGAVVAVLVLLAGTGAAYAASATLGGALYVVGSSLVIEDTAGPVTVRVSNRSTVPVAATLTVDGPGYALEPADLGALAPDGTATARLSAVGAGSARITARLVPLDAAESGTDRVGLALSLTLRHRTALEQLVHDVAPGLVLLALALALVVTVNVRALWRGRSPTTAEIVRRTGGDPLARSVFSLILQLRLRRRRP